MQFILQRAILGLLWEPKPDLRRRGLHRHPVPANTALAHLVAVDVLARDRVRGLAWHVPRQCPDQDEAHHGGGHDQHKPSTEAPPTDQPVGLDPRYHRHVDRRQVPHNRVR